MSEAAPVPDETLPVDVPPQPPSRPGHPWSGVALALFGAVAFSGKAIIVKLGYRHGADAITLLALRMLVALPFFAMMAWWARRDSQRFRLRGSDRWKVVGLGFSGYYLASFLDFAGLQYITATLERLILYLTPTLVLLISALLFKRRPARRQLWALAVSYIGVALAFGHDLELGGNGIALGGLLVFLSALSYAAYLVGSGEVVARVGAVRLTAYASAVAAGFCILHFLLVRPWHSLLELPHEVYGLSLLNGTLCTVLPVLATMMAVQRLGSALASQLGMIGPVSTIVLSLFLLGEPMGVWQIVGTVLVLTGVFTVTRPAK
ncbi:DMT family transporter [Pseudoxanthomonas sacheonensis]|uniref:DMT family transporter n=1 Tax=Pseudoxanthomonas sacheonensis TaxID=443615 RepID=UPI0013D153DD|nr:DMT family transporter [Pseudoxanthomonas sacheonensis]KAF1706409.1 EamA family transporter [Pseudoxanthomonas sacheonensis]